ncbi:MAG: hypothetical protein JNG89_08195, partial [Planctomycetaceae bacterium]|nr:hypothetical protein [Planctomycetaceae bacterium]
AAFGTGADEAAGFAPGVAGEQGQPATIEIKRASAEEVTTTFLALLAAGDMEQAVTLISGRATGILAKLREGTASDEDVQRLQEAAASTDKTSRPKGGSHVQFSVRSEKTILLIEADQKEEGSSIVKMEVRDTPRKRGSR